MMPGSMLPGSMMPGDDQLFHELGEALSPDPAEPSAEEIEGLHAVVAAERWPATKPAWPSRARVRTRLSGSALVVILALIIASGSAAAAMSGASLPAPLRAVATTLGLPVDDVVVAQARSTMDDLSNALKGNDPVLVLADASQLRTLLAQMSAEDRAKVEPRADRLLAMAAADELSPAVRTVPVPTSSRAGGPLPAVSTPPGSYAVDPGSAPSSSAPGSSTPISPEPPSTATPAGPPGSSSTTDSSMTDPSTTGLSTADSSPSGSLSGGLPATDPSSSSDPQQPPEDDPGGDQVRSRDEGHHASQNHHASQLATGSGRRARLA